MSKCILDIGSNSLGGFRRLVPILGIDESWFVILVEPNPENFEDIYEKMKNIPNSILLKVALATENKKYTLLTRSDMKGDSGATIMGIKFITDSIGSVNQAVPEYVEFEVEGMTLRDMLSQITEDEIYIKMDCEGPEMDVLEQFPFEYQDRIKKLFVEFHAHDDAARQRRDNIISQFNYLGIELLIWD